MNSPYDALFEQPTTISDIPEIERGVVTAMLCPSLRLLNMYYHVLLPEHFENQVLRVIVKIILAYYTKFKKYPTLDVIEHEIREAKASVKQELLDEYLGELDRIESFLQHDFDNVEYYKEQLQTFLKKQYLRNKCFEMLTALTHKDFDNAKVDKLVHEITHVPSFDIDLGTSVLDLTELPRPSSRAISTGFHNLDKCLYGGGLGSGQLGVVGGIAGVGKSSFLIQLGCIAMTLGHNVAHYTMELDKSVIMERYAKRLTGETNVYFYEDGVQFDPRTTRKMQNYKRFKGNLTVVQSDMPRTLDIEAHLDRLYTIKSLKTDLLLLDSPDDMLPNREFRDIKTYERYWQIYMDLLSLGKRLEIPIWGITQFTKEALNKNQVTLKHNSDSWKKVAKTNVYLGISQTEQEKKEKVFRVTVLKNNFFDSEYVSVLMELDLATSMIRDKGFVNSEGDLIDEAKPIEYEEEV